MAGCVDGLPDVYGGGSVADLVFELPNAMHALGIAADPIAKPVQGGAFIVVF